MSDTFFATRAQDTTQPLQPAEPSSVFEHGDLTINYETKKVAIGQTPVHLPPKQYEYLELLAQCNGQVITKRMFFQAAYGEEANWPQPKIADVFICSIRKKLGAASGGKKYIETVWGRGHVLCDPTTPAA